MLGLPRFLSVVNDGTVFAVARDVLGARIDVVARVNPVERIRIVGLFVGVILQVVVPEPLLGDVPVAVSNDAGNHATHRRLWIALPILGTHELVFTARVAGRTDDLRLILGAELLEKRVQTNEKRGRAVAHDRHEMRAPGGLLGALAELGREFNERVLQLVVIVLARQI